MRVIKAANEVVEKSIADIILLGNKEKIEKICNENNISLNNNIKIIDYLKESNMQEKFVNELYNQRKNKGVDKKNAKELVQNSIYFATMMLYFNMADGIVSGAVHTTTETLRPALQIIRKKEKISKVSSFFIMESENKNIGKDGIMIFSDCALIEVPTKKNLMDIANESVNSYRKFIGDDPKVAFLSYSSFGSAKGKSVYKIKEVVQKLKEKNVDYEIDGEMQFDTAVINEVAKNKAPSLKVAGNANILIFPNLEAGNIGYKIAQRIGNMKAYGPITQGMNKPVNDLSRGCSIDDIVGVIAITCVQAQNSI